MESDESVANFDPEFTTADVRDAGPDEIMDLDDEDPSEDWVALSQSISASMHTPNGPLGSDRPPAVAAQAQAQSQSERPASPTAAGSAKGIAIGVPQRKKKTRDPVGSPLTSSVQENFRGFTYHGSESVVPDGAAGGLAEQLEREKEEAVHDEEFYADEDDDGPVGRYADRRRNGDLDGFDDDMRF